MKIPNVIKTLPSKVVTSLNKTGERVCTTIKDARLKADKFAKSTDVKEAANKVGKNTIVGAIVTIGALVLSFQLVKNIRNKVKETNNNK